MEQADAKPDFRKWNWIAAGGNATTAASYFLRLLNDIGNASSLDVMAISGTTGNVGIGTGNPQATLHAATSANADSLIVENWGTSLTNDLVRFNMTAKGDNSNYALMSVYNTSGTAFYVRGDRNVGIGTTNPTTALHIYNGGFGAAQIDGPAGTFRVTRYSTAGTVRFDAGITSGSETGSNAGSDFYISRANDAGTSLDFPFYITRSTGNVGIGTISPATKLDVSGGIASNRNWIYLAAGGDTNHAIGNVAGDGEQFRFHNFLDFRQSNGLARMYINTDGNVGIGTTNPTYKFEVVGGSVRIQENDESILFVNNLDRNEMYFIGNGTNQFSFRSQAGIFSILDRPGTGPAVFNITQGIGASGGHIGMGTTLSTMRIEAICQ